MSVVCCIVIFNVIQVIATFDIPKPVIKIKNMISLYVSLPPSQEPAIKMAITKEGVEKLSKNLTETRVMEIMILCILFLFFLFVDSPC